MVKCGVLFEVRTELLNTIYMSLGFKVKGYRGRLVPQNVARHLFIMWKKIKVIVST
jgi:hypothetical protein